jgi:hypothetical protein
MDEDFRLEPQKKPDKSLNYKEKVKAGLISGGLKRTALKKYSKKNEEKLDRYHWMCYTDTETQSCFMCGLVSHKDILQRHHPKGRGGDNILYYKYVCADATTCTVRNPQRRGGHDGIHSNPNWAREKGYLEM